MSTPTPFGRGVPGNRWDLVAEDEAPLRPVSVIVAHYDQQRELDRTLAALARQTYPAELLEIIVVDDGSPTSPDVPPGVRLEVQDDLGFRLSAARNRGVGASSGEVVCFLDADTVPEPDYVERLTALPRVLPEAVTVGRRRHADLASLPLDAEVEASAAGVELEEPRWLADAYRASGNLLDADDRSYRFVIGAVVACTRWFFDEVGGFDETFTTYGGEDWEWAHRAWISGAVLAHVPAAVAWHDGPDWAERGEPDARRRAAKNEETWRLASRIAVTGSRPRGVLATAAAAADVVVVLETADSWAAAFACVDSLLRELPQARVVVPASCAERFGGDPRVSASAPPARVLVRLRHPVRFGPDSGIAQAAADAGSGDLGVVDLGHGVRVESTRARLRAARWGGALAWRTEHRRADLAPVPADVDLEAYLGGWG